MAPLKLKHGAWVVVADGEKALFLRNEGDGLHPNLQTVEHVEQDNPPAHEQGADRPGRFNDGPSPHRSAVEETDFHRLAKQRFADKIADKLYKLVHRGEIDDLVIVAPPPALGELRPRLHKAVAGVVRAEVPKSLTNMPVPEIEAALDAH